MDGKVEVTQPSNKRAKLEPPYDAGDCGYYAIFVGLLYLGLQAKTDKELARIINNSILLETLFLDVSITRRLVGVSNVKTIENVLTALNTTGWESISFKELLNEFGNGIRRSLVTSEWGLDYFKTMLREGAWVIDNHKWMDLPPLKHLNGKILDLMAQLAEGKDVSIEKAGELRFQATIEVFKKLKDETLGEMAKAVIQKYYGPGSSKVWVDDDFLKYFSKHLFPKAANLFFNPEGIEITGKGPSKIHWYVDVPKNELTDFLLKTVNSGPSKYLKEIEVYRVKNKDSDSISALLQDMEELLHSRQELISSFKKVITTLQKQMNTKNRDSRLFPEELIDGVSALEYIDKELPGQETIDNAFMPIIALDESFMNEYQELSTLGKSMDGLNEQIKKIEKEVKLKKDKLSTSTLTTTTNLSIHAATGTSTAAPKDLGKKGNHKMGP